MECKLLKPYRDILFHTFTDRYGGVSKPPYDSLNLATHVGDDIKNVMKNRVIISKMYSLDLRNLIYMDQIHSDHIEVIKDSMQTKIPNCDGLLTDQKGISLMVLVADCIPILLFDPVKKVIGAVHAGRNSTFKKIAKKSILKMQEVYGSESKNIIVCLGASIHKCCYEISKDIADIAIKNFGEIYIKRREERYFLDLQLLNRDQLLEVGVKEENISISDECSCCNDEYFSYRRDGITGRFAGIISLRRDHEL